MLPYGCASLALRSTQENFSSQRIIARRSKNILLTFIILIITYFFRKTPSPGSEAEFRWCWSCLRHRHRNLGAEARLQPCPEPSSALWTAPAPLPPVPPLCYSRGGGFTALSGAGGTPARSRSVPFRCADLGGSQRSRHRAGAPECQKGRGNEGQKFGLELISRCARGSCCSLFPRNRFCVSFAPKLCS